MHYLAPEFCRPVLMFITGGFRSLIIQICQCLMATGGYRKASGSSIQITHRFHWQKNVPRSGGAEAKSIHIDIAYSHLHDDESGKCCRVRFGEEIEICVEVC
jgi:hypothetical protein